MKIWKNNYYSAVKKNEKGQQRILTDFENYFRFNDVLEDYWCGANDSKKLFYFSVYLWWTLTVILPLRPTEFLLTPRKCIERKNGDYKLLKYSVPDKMANEIRQYIESIAEMPASSLNTLFVQNPHYSYFSWSTPPRSTYYTYSNLSRFVECATYEMHQKRKNHSVEMLATKPVCVGETVPVTGGCCDSSEYMAGNISDCIRNMGMGGELGDCKCCPHFIDGKSGRYLLFSNAEDRKKQVDEDSKYLMGVLDMVRKGRGCNEDIQSALLRLQHSSSRYSQYLYKNMEGR